VDDRRCKAFGGNDTRRVGFSIFFIGLFNLIKRGGFIRVDNALDLTHGGALVVSV
jgi:hypothetical protein